MPFLRTPERKDAANAMERRHHIIAEARKALSPSLLKASGRALYSPASTLDGSSPFYFLGLNPGENETDDQHHSHLTIEEDLARLEQDLVVEHAYLDERWKGCMPGRAPIQMAGREVFAILCGNNPIAGDRLLRETPVSNLILPRSKSEAALLEKTGFSSAQLLAACWPFHQAVVDVSGCQFVITHAVGAARKLAERLNLGAGECRPSGWGGTLKSLYAWQLSSGVRLLAIPNLSRYKPNGDRALALSAFFDEFGAIH